MYRPASPLLPKSKVCNYTQGACVVSLMSPHASYSVWHCSCVDLILTSHSTRFHLSFQTEIWVKPSMASKWCGHAWHKSKRMLYLSTCCWRWCHIVFRRGNLLLHAQVQAWRDHKTISEVSVVFSWGYGALCCFPLPIKFMILRPAAGDAPQIQTASRREERLPLVVCAPRVAVSAAAGGVWAQRRAMHGVQIQKKVIGVLVIIESVFSLLFTRLHHHSHWHICQLKPPELRMFHVFILFGKKIVVGEKEKVNFYAVSRKQYYD